MEENKFIALFILQHIIKNNNRNLIDGKIKIKVLIK